ncbi:Zn-ribbon domain-containing OB-fold protein [Hoeflea poritis]|uniref:Zn-ribbon domain-containing OB-fold protein n=1 Tax=Hoeflea poritis TaxID=2993659 RepID=A0ABT4VUX4_9HYPH|nr:Zn-ribbon domain-containing OB-fold protein [Hoeflea poritis]MDA4848517.1 Zn-ribbon domain-containing OB-fold protein [Hoeflea poritis]
MMQDRTYPDPTPNLETEPFWAAAKDEKLLLKYCRTCGKAHYYPRAVCPLCGSTETEWREASGRGEIYSFTQFRRAPVPYVLAYVTLIEGPAMLTNVVDCEFDDLKIGQPVGVTFRDTQAGFKLPVFRPV